MPVSQQRLLLCIVPALLVGTAFEIFLGPRHDYTGHFGAGYGGTLGALMVCLRMIPPERFERWGLLSIGPVCLACILLGVYTEATTFRIAKFDELDFCNQSLGAVLAGCAAVAFVPPLKLPEEQFDRGLIVAITFLLVGACFAVA